MECILNLTQSPAAAQMFFCVDDANADTASAMNMDKTAARTRLTLLLALTNSSTRGTALAAVAALSQILAFEAGAASFLALTSPSPTSGVASAKDTASKRASDDRTPTRRLLTLVAESAGIISSSAGHLETGSAERTHDDGAIQSDADMLARAATAICALIDAGGATVRTSVRDAGGLKLLETLMKTNVVREMGLDEMIGDAIVALKVL